jgi:hypothetical protein
MLHDVQALARNPIPLHNLRDDKDYHELKQPHYGLNAVPVKVLEPTSRDGAYSSSDISRFLKMEPHNLGTRTSLFDKGDVIEFGCFGDHLMRINGNSINTALSHYFTTWEVLTAWEAWSDTFIRWASVKSKRMSKAYGATTQNWLDRDLNSFVLNDGYTEEAFHQAGAAFVTVFIDSLTKNNASFQLDVTYVAHTISY